MAKVSLPIQEKKTKYFFVKERWNAYNLLYFFSNISFNPYFKTGGPFSILCVWILFQPSHAWGWLGLMTKDSSQWLETEGPERDKAKVVLFVPLFCIQGSVPENKV